MDACVDGKKFALIVMQEASDAFILGGQYETFYMSPELLYLHFISEHFNCIFKSYGEKGCSGVDEGGCSPAGWGCQQMSHAAWLQLWADMPAPSLPGKSLTQRTHFACTWDLPFTDS